MAPRFDPAWRERPVGIDVSHHQGTVDYEKMAASGVSFVYVKATEGFGYRDPRLRENVEGARAAGLLVGLYHYGRISTPTVEDAEAEAEWHMQAYRDLGLTDSDGYLIPGILPPVLDVEWDQKAAGISRAERTEWCVEFLDSVTVGLDCDPIVYTGPNYSFYHLDVGILSSYRLWMARYSRRERNGGEPARNIVEPDRQISGWPWLFWQHSGKWPRPDRRGHIDANRFSGDLVELRSLAGLDTEVEDTPISWWRFLLRLIFGVRNA